MVSIDPKKILSMAQLQKLSSKRLAKYGTPLFVMDLKSKRKVFVILEADAYEKLAQKELGNGALTNVSCNREGGGILPDYRSMGLLWDRAGMTNKEFHKCVKSPENQNYSWAAKRLMEYAPSNIVTKILSLGELAGIMKNVPMRPIYKEAWSRAIQYWSQNP